MANRIATLEEIKQAMEAEEVETFAPLRVYVVNHLAEVNFPRKYVYTACPRRISGFGRFGRTCGRSLEGTHCKHHPNQITGVDVFRFELFLSDATVAGRPLQATIFDAAGALLNNTAENFKKLHESVQTKHVVETIALMPEFFVTLRVHDKGTYVQNMVFIGNGPVPPSLTWDSPRRGLSFGRDAAGTPTHTRHALLFDGAGPSTPGNTHEAVKEKVNELVDLIAETLTLRGK